MDRSDDLTTMLRNGLIGRREFLKRAIGLGLSLPAAGALLAACGGGDDDGGEAAPPAEPAEPAPPADTGAGAGGAVGRRPRGDHDQVREGARTARTRPS